MSFFDKLIERLPTERQTAEYLQRLEERTGLKADRFAASAERAATVASEALQGLERRAADLELFVARVNEHVEGKERASSPSDES